MPAESYATWADVEAVHGDLKVVEQHKVTTLLAHASTLIRNAEGCYVAARLADGTLDRGVVQWIAIEMVKAVLNNPKGKREERIDDYAYVRDNSNSAGELTITPAQLEKLLPPSAAQGAFTIRPAATHTARPADATWAAW